MVYNTQNRWVFEPCPSSGILVITRLNKFFYFFYALVLMHPVLLARFVA
jgi:hypothetical protein